MTTQTAYIKYLQYTSLHSYGLLCSRAVCCKGKANTVKLSCVYLKTLNWISLH